MKNINKLFIGFFLLVLAVVVYVYSAGPSNNPKEEQTPKENNAILLPTDGIQQPLSDEKYIHFSSGVLNENRQKTRVLFFYANWCPTCRPVDQELGNDPNKLPEDVVVIRVNYNDTDTDQEEKQLAKKYGITYQHTFVEIDSVGNALQIWNGGGVAEILERLQDKRN